MITGKACLNFPSATFVLVLSLGFVVGCQPRADQQLFVKNETDKSVVVTWREDGRPRATIPPYTQQNLGGYGNWCETSEKTAVFDATIADGKVRTLTTPICPGTVWRILP
ncbi:hypothetical protein EDD27_10507 [Nonomuraea polychroma]|uniref:Lipoprotein n=1 Tax=Nonomuraea polychroma TaxID=46176 RepID=A0A438MPV7_9ACTN|nr:hypothetical protein EDD27_10507 [Nonomuraea polychroma]